MQKFYKQDLAHIHDLGYGEHARQASAEIVQLLAKNNIANGLVVDLGCGSGITAQTLSRDGHQVLGIDISDAMVNLARARVPQAKFYVASLFNVELPPCEVVTSLGECVNYLFDPDHQEDRLQQLFKRVYQALKPGGMFIFDLAEPGQVQKGEEQHFSEGNDWLVLVKKEENLKAATLTRHIVTLRRIGETYRRDDEVHHLRLYHSAAVTQKLRRAGFQVRTTRSYGAYRLPKAHTAFVALKPLRA